MLRVAPVGRKNDLLYLSHRPTLLFPVFTLQHWGYAMTQLVEGLRYKPEGRGHWNFSLT